MSETTSQATSSIRSSRTRAPRKPKRNQIPYGILVVLAMVVIGILQASRNQNLGFFWMTGGIFGFILQKSRFCFTASMRDPVITGSTSVTRAVLIAFAVTTILFASIQYSAVSKGLPMPGQSYIVPISFATVIGAFLFGIGMVIAGGCASGTLMRVGEGFFMQILSLFFFVVGSLIGAAHFGWWKENFIVHGPKVFLPDVFGWVGAVVIQLLVILCLYRAAMLWEQKKVGSAPEA
ncbi:MAG: YeeE/YedE thiosulfate transporter family protein [Candidatus Limiplasma sp.]|nr:YeeE/YedE thiosulfate transporter family protein [Candidatus Limiplasma sp.]